MGLNKANYVNRAMWTFAGCMLLVAAVSKTGCDGRADELSTFAPWQPTFFTLGVEQDGRRIPVLDHKVTLARKPFTIVFYLEQMGPMLVQASFSPRMMNMAGEGKRLETILIPAGSIAENPRNPDRLIYVHDDGLYHNWGYLGPNSHRFDPNGVAKLPEGGYLCRRTVEKIVDHNAEIPVEIPVERCPQDRIYLLFIKTKPNAGSGPWVEKQRDWLELRFTG